jgi:DNA-binding transcriptional LysR family regulator
MAIRKLEESFGTALFERTTRHVQLTPAGVAAREEIEKTLFHFEQAKRYAMQTVDGVRGKITIGSVGSATLSLIPRLIPPFRLAYPNVELELSEHPSNIILKMVEQGKLDIGLVRSPVMGNYRVKILDLEKDRFIAVVPQSFHVTGNRISLKQLANEPFVSYSSQSAPGLNYAVSHICQRAGFLPKVIYETTQIQATISLVASELGVALVPALHRTSSTPNVRFLELEDSQQDHPLGLILAYSSENETRLAENFRQIAMAASV